MNYKINENGCWVFQGSLNQNGYGRVRIKSKDYIAHRLIAHIAIRPLTSELQVVAHKCDNPSCINPEHLFITTSAGNTLDRHLKGRTAHGSKHPSSKINDDIVKQIIHLYSTGVSQNKISKMFNISQSLVSNIIHKKTWKHVVT
jgi:hypothetical protein